MAEIELSVAKRFFHQPCKDPCERPGCGLDNPHTHDHFSPDDTCENIDWALAWRHISVQGVNAEMFLRSEHTPTEWVFVFDYGRFSDPTTPGMQGEPAPISSRNDVPPDSRYTRPAGKLDVPFYRDSLGRSYSKVEGDQISEWLAQELAWHTQQREALNG